MRLIGVTLIPSGTHEAMLELEYLAHGETRWRRKRFRHEQAVRVFEWARKRIRRRGL